MTGCADFIREMSEIEDLEEEITVVQILRTLLQVDET